MIASTRATIVIDDEPANCDFIVRLFQTAGMDVHGADTGRAGLALAEQVTALTLALIDHDLPDVGGIELVRRFRALHQDAVLVMATIHDTRDIIDQAFEAGVDIYLVKPHGFMELYRRVQAWSLDDASLHRLVIDQYGPRPYRGPKRNTQALTAVSV
jgi:DNA-binding response OmpR family regulator